MTDPVYREQVIGFIKETLTEWIGNMLRSLGERGYEVELYDIWQAVQDTADEIKPDNNDFDEFWKEQE